MKVRMKRTTAISIMAMLSMLVFFVTPVKAMEVVIPDPGLEAALRDTPEIPDTGPITDTDLATLTELSASIRGIENLTGLEYCVNLTKLGLQWNKISELGPLAGLTNLEELLLTDNTISELGPLSGLTNLTVLWLGINTISELGPLSGLVNLEVLDLHTNTISELGPLSGLTNLTELWLSANTISELGPLSGLVNMDYLNLTGNNIRDIQPLVDNPGLGKVTLLFNPLSYEAINTDIPTLEARGVTVWFDDRTPTFLLKDSGDGQTGLTLSTLPSPFVVLVLDENGDPYEGVPVTFNVTAGGGSLDVENATADADGLAQATLTLGPNPGTNTVEVTAVEITTTVTFDATAESRPPIADAGPDQEALAGEELWFYGEGSYDPDGVVVSYEWDFGDGSPPESGLLVFHAFDAPGVYSVTLTVEDDYAVQGTDTAIVTILTPAEFVDDMIATLKSWGLPANLEKQLIDSLSSAIEPLTKGDEKAAIRRLRGFIHQCENLRLKKLRPQEADYLIEGAERLIAAIKY